MKIECRNCRSKNINARIEDKCNMEENGRVNHVFTINGECRECKNAIYGTAEYLQNQDGSEVCSSDAALVGGRVVDYGVT